MSRFKPSFPSDTSREPGSGASILPRIAQIFADKNESSFQPVFQPALIRAGRAIALRRRLAIRGEIGGSTLALRLTALPKPAGWFVLP